MGEAGGAGAQDTDAEGVGAVFGDDFYGVDDVAFTFGHFLTFFIEDEAVEVNVFEGYFAGAVEAEHDHAGDPGEEDVGGGFHDGERIKRRCASRRGAVFYGQLIGFWDKPRMTGNWGGRLRWDAEDVVPYGLIGYLMIGGDIGPLGGGEPGVEGVFVAVVGDAVFDDEGLVGVGVENPLVVV